MSPLTSISEEVIFYSASVSQLVHLPLKAAMASSPAVPVNIRESLSKARTHPEKLSLDKLDEFVKAASSGDRSPEFAPKEVAEEEAKFKSNMFKISTHNISGRTGLVCSDFEEPPTPVPTITKPDFSRSAIKEHGDFKQVLQVIRIKTVEKKFVNNSTTGLPFCGSDRL